MTRYFQYALFFSSFLTFGLADALTAVIMIKVRGSIIEYNTLYAYIYETQGPQIFIIIKVFSVITVLAFIFICQYLSKGKTYWKVNGLLMALTATGTMATVANMQATIGHHYLSPEHILIIHLVMAVLLISIGDYIDTAQDRKRDR